MSDPPVKPVRAALYTRVSTDSQTTDNQRQALTAEAARRGWLIVAEYEDAGISGAKSRDKRPGLDSMLTDATRGKFDVLMSWAVDRIGRSLRDLLNTLGDLEGAHVDLYLHQQGLDTRTPSGRAMFGMLGIFAEFERSMIQARIRAGLDKRRRDGKRLGRPALGREKDIDARATGSDKRREAEKLLRSGASLTRVIKTTGLGSSTVQGIATGMRRDGRLPARAPVNAEQPPA